MRIDNDRLVNHVATWQTDQRPVVARATITAGGTTRAFDVVDYSWDAANSDPASQTAVANQAFKLTKIVDEDSKVLWTQFLSGGYSGSVVVDVLAPDGTTATRFTFYDARLSNMEFGGRGVDANVPTEELSLKFTRITMLTTAPDGTTITRTWDYVTNQGS